jgi:polar amino acid transport system substrate-binding protein
VNLSFRRAIGVIGLVAFAAIAMVAPFPAAATTPSPTTIEATFPPGPPPTFDGTESQTVLPMLKNVYSPNRLPATAQWIVAIKPLDPFVIKADDGTYSGFSIDVWNEIAKRNAWKTTWQWNEKVTQVLKSVEDHTADVGIAGITINKERETKVDFSQPMFNAGLQIAVSGKQKSGLRAALDQVFSPQLLKLVGLLAAGIFLAGNVLWVFRFRKRAETRKYKDGLAAGVWFAGKTLGSADFGDAEPRKPAGQLIALLWMFTGIIVIQYFTALTTTQLTIQKIEGNIQGVKDLPGKSLVTVDGSTADKWLNEQGLGHQRVTKIENAYPMLLNGDVEAIVYDAPVLLRWTATAANGKARTVGAVFKPESYGIALQQGSPLRETVDQTLLEMQSDGTFDDLYKKWFAA